VIVNSFVHVEPPFVEYHRGAFAPHDPEKLVITT
jgi:hypothetical protein